MSFSDLERHGGNGSTSPPFPAEGSPLKEINSEYTKLTNTAKSSIFAISANVASIQRMVGHLGTSKDTVDMRGKLQNLVQATQDLVKQTTADLKRCGQMAAGGDQPPARKMEQGKLSKDFQVVLSRFQHIQRTYAEKSREFVAKAKEQTSALEHQHGNGYGDDGDDDINAPLMKEEQLRQQELVRLDREIEYSEGVIAEREHDIVEIEQAIHEVNEIFRDLGALVNEQQGMFDNIEANIESSAVRSGDATVELEGARRYQKKAQKRLICLLLTFFTVLTILILVLVLK